MQKLLENQWLYNVVMPILYILYDPCRCKIVSANTLLTDHSYQRKEERNRENRRERVYRTEMLCLREYRHPTHPKTEISEHGGACEGAYIVPCHPSHATTPEYIPQRANNATYRRGVRKPTKAYYFPTAHRAQCARYQLQDIPREAPSTDLDGSD